MQLHPTYLFIGPATSLQQEALAFVKKHLCENKEHKACVTCNKINNRQHQNLVWIEPEKDFTVSETDIIFEKTKFALDENEHFFFVLCKTETFNQATANKLLKVLEEPPPGYHFILLTSNENAMLPTIISRSFVKHIQAPATQAHHPLVEFFIQQEKLNDPFNFQTTLRNNKLTDSQSITLVESIFHHYATQINNHYTKQKELTPATYNLYQKRIQFLEECMKMPPQSGSSNLFWKNTYLLFPR